MGKRKGVITTCAFLCMMLLVAGVLLLRPQSRVDEEDKTITLGKVKEIFEKDIQELKEGKYKNLLCTDFESSVEEIEGIYSLEILIDNSAESGSLIDSLKIREDVIDKFYEGGFDKSNLLVKVYMTGKDFVRINYDDFVKEASNGKYDNALVLGTIIDNDRDEHGYIVQVGYNRLHTWLSKKGLGTIHPSAMGEFKSVTPYLMGNRQGTDVKIQLKDGVKLLSEIEKIALEYMNSEKFPLVRADGISFGIGEARVIETENYEGVCFMTRRVYKGIPFEYGANSGTGLYHDKVGHDGGEITYVESVSPDTMLGFSRTDGTVVEKNEILEMITAGDAFRILAERIGENSVYEVRGVELVYRNCEIPEDKSKEISNILEPKWKIITINQNDDKYTLFYVDVVTGEITDRFEYFYN